MSTYSLKESSWMPANLYKCCAIRKKCLWGCKYAVLEYLVWYSQQPENAHLCISTPTYFLRSLKIGKDLDVTICAMSQERLSLCFWAGKTHLSFLIYRDKLDQGSHTLEKYLNIQDCLEKSLKLKFALKSTWKTLKGLKRSLYFTIYRRIQQCLWRPKSV